MVLPTAVPVTNGPLLLAGNLEPCCGKLCWSGCICGAAKPSFASNAGKVVRVVNATVAWPLVEDEYTPCHPTPAGTLALRQATHCTISKVAPHMEHLSDKASVAALREFTKAMERAKQAGDVYPSAWEAARDSLLLLLAPTAPQIADMLWRRLGHPNSIRSQPFPVPHKKPVPDK